MKAKLRYFSCFVFIWFVFFRVCFAFLCFFDSALVKQHNFLTGEKTNTIIRKRNPSRFSWTVLDVWY